MCPMRPTVSAPSASSICRASSCFSSLGATAWTLISSCTSRARSIAWSVPSVRPARPIWTTGLRLWAWPRSHLRCEPLSFAIVGSYRSRRDDVEAPLVAVCPRGMDADRAVLHVQLLPLRGPLRRDLQAAADPFRDAPLGAALLVPLGSPLTARLPAHAALPAGARSVARRRARPLRRLCRALARAPRGLPDGRMGAPCRGLPASRLALGGLRAQLLLQSPERLHELCDDPARRLCHRALSPAPGGGAADLPPGGGAGAGRAPGLEDAAPAPLPLQYAQLDLHPARRGPGGRRRDARAPRRLPAPHARELRRAGGP